MPNALPVLIDRFRDLADVNWATFATGEVPVWDSATGKMVGQVISEGGLLASITHLPSTLTSYAATTSNADVDATNLAVTFTAPASGTVEVELQAMANGGSVRHTWLLRVGSADIPGTEQLISNDASINRKTYRQVVSGLVPGQAYTIKWGQRGASTAPVTYAGVSTGNWPAHMRVYSVANVTSNYSTILVPALGTLGGQGWVLRLPQGPGPRPLIIYNHGRGAPETEVTAALQATIMNALLNAGYMVAASNANGDNWGNDAGLATVKALHDYIHSAHPVSDVIFWGASHGGLISLLLTAGLQAIPNVKGFFGQSPICNLAAVYADTGQTFKAGIDTAYGITGVSPNTYAEKTAGHDPVLRAAANFAGKGFRFYVSPLDSTVPSANHATPMLALVSGVALEANIVTCSGSHADASQFQPSDVVAFVQRCIA